MTFTATVVRVLIASPSDTELARSLVREVIQDWNSLHAAGTGVILLPVMWERDATPEIGDRPQSIINRQLVADSDLLIGIFWTRLGTPTGEADSGTVEEIEQFIHSGKGKRALVYFSEEPAAPRTIDLAELGRLMEFRQSLLSRAIVDVFDRPDELRMKCSAALTRVARSQFEEPRDGGSRARPWARIVLQPREYRMVSAPVPGEPIRDNVYYTAEPILVIENEGTAAAEDFTIELRAERGTPPRISASEKPVRRFAPRSSLTYRLGNSAVRQFDVVMKWTENGRGYTEVQTLRL